jgi:hypothetical protein
MTRERYTAYVDVYERTRCLPLDEISAGPGVRLRAERPTSPSLYAVPVKAGGYEWATWEEATRRGWSERYGPREYQGEELERRFLVLYYPEPARAWPFFWRQVEGRPLRLEVCRNRGEAEWLASRVIAKRQLGFRRVECTRDIVATWGWDDREIHYHAECDEDCGCSGPLPGRPFVLIAEFEREAAAMRPDVRLEREAWRSALTVEQAMALTSPPCDGSCSPACARCAALYEERDAAWEWCSTHRRQVRAWRREQKRASDPARPAPVGSEGAGAGGGSC